MTAIFAIYTWIKQHNKDEANENKKLAALYVNPFLMACEELQSRLYNILERKGLETLKSHDENYAEETLYMIIQYMGWERCVRRYGPYTQDKKVINLTEAIRATFATDGPENKRGPFCFFRPQQKALSQIIMKRIAGEFGPEFDTISLYDFKKKLSSQALEGMKSMKETRDALLNAKNVIELEGRYRLAEIQNYLVILLTYIEEKEKFSLFPGLREKAKRDKVWEDWAKDKGWYQA